MINEKHYMIGLRDYLRTPAKYHQIVEEGGYDLLAIYRASMPCYVMRQPLKSDALHNFERFEQQGYPQRLTFFQVLKQEIKNMKQNIKHLFLNFKQSNQ